MLVFIYVNENIKAVRRTDLEAEHIEILWLEVYPHKSKHINIMQVPIVLLQRTKSIM
jgi:hypothetical protein